MPLSAVHKRDNTYDFNCPSGGTWYSCGHGSKFVGCCAAEACAIGCSDGNLRAGSFNASEYGHFPDLQCPTGSGFYTCKYTDPPFWGCCKTEACSNGCPSNNLAAAVYGNNPVETSAYSPIGGLVTAVTTSAVMTLSTNSAQESATATSQNTITVTAAPIPPKHQNVGAIAGGAAGGVVLLALLISLLIYYRRHASTSLESRNSQMQNRNSMLANAIVNNKDTATSPNSSNLSPYSSPVPEYTSHNFPGWGQPKQPGLDGDYYSTAHEGPYELSPDNFRTSELENPHLSLSYSPPQAGQDVILNQEIERTVEAAWMSRP